MTEITRENLELAALAIGETVECTEADFHGCEDTSTIYTGVMLRGVQVAWRPHTDIADAARLAIHCAVTTMFRVDGHVLAFVPPGLYPVEVHHDGTEADKIRAYCEAITLCAAEIGRQMKEAK